MSVLTKRQREALNAVARGLVIYRSGPVPLRRMTKYEFYAAGFSSAIFERLEESGHIKREGWHRGEASSSRATVVLTELGRKEV